MLNASLPLRDTAGCEPPAVFGIAVNVPPAAGSTPSPSKPLGEPSLTATTRLRPSGVHAGSPALSPPGTATASPPEIGTVYTAGGPELEYRVKATVFPSGENAGSLSSYGAWASNVGVASQGVVTHRLIGP